MQSPPALDIVRKSLVSRGHDAAIVSHMPGIRRITGFSGSNALLLVSQRDALLLTDGRYAEQVTKQTSNLDFGIVAGSLIEGALQSSIIQEAKAVAIQGGHFSAEDFVRTESALKSRGVDIVVTKDWLQVLFAAKTSTEINLIKKAQAITDNVFDELLPTLRDGVSEKEVAAEIVYMHLRAGADRMSFDPIVAFGKNSALPHARPTKRVLRRNDAILIDMGCFVDGYASDMTRMVFFGTPSSEYSHVYDIVLEAKSRAINNVHRGVSCKDLDTMARDHISASGYGDNFIHSLGHGIGLEIHEYPAVSARSRAHLESGMVITIEPGIYIEDSFGVRIEDIVVVEDGGCEVLTRATSEMLVIG